MTLGQQRAIVLRQEKGRSAFGVGQLHAAVSYGWLRHGYFGVFASRSEDAADQTVRRKRICPEHRGKAGYNVLRRSGYVVRFAGIAGGC